MCRKLYPESAARLTTSVDIKNYIYGGRGIVTLEAPSGKSHTYIFAKPKNTDVFPDDVLFVYALHEGVKQFYVGMVEKDKFRLTHNSRYLPDTEIVKGAYYILRMATEPELKTPMILRHNGMCAYCGRQLSSEKSIATGIGPKCTKMRLVNNMNPHSVIDDSCNIDDLPDYIPEDINDEEEFDSQCG